MSNRKNLEIQKIPLDRPCATHPLTMGLRSFQSTWWVEGAQRGVGGQPKIVAKRDSSVSNSAWKAFFRWTWTSILLPKSWVSSISPNIWRDTVSKWTHRLIKEAGNLERGLYCACLGSYPRLSGEGSDLIKKVLVLKRLPLRMSTIEH